MGNLMEAESDKVERSLCNELTGLYNRKVKDLNLTLVFETYKKCVPEALILGIWNSDKCTHVYCLWASLFYYKL